MNLLRIVLIGGLWAALQIPVSKAQEFELGVAQVDVTPDYPVRLSGFGFRREESEGVTHRIWAKALAIKDPAKGAAVVITVDNLGIPAEMTQEVARRLNQAVDLPHQRLAITASHTHTAPMLTQVAPTLFGTPIPTKHQMNIDRYTRELTDQLEAVALSAIHNLQSGRLEWTQGEVGFGKNRRTAGGPVDHDLPMMVVRGDNDDLRAIWFSYACHCVTLSNNKVSGDWAGSAQIEIQKHHPEAVIMASIGCGADQNPDSGVTSDKVEMADAQGLQIAQEIDRLLRQPLTPIQGPLNIQLTGIPLAFDTPRTRHEWEERAQQDNAIGHHARANLARLDRGETLPDHIDYPIQTWLFGNDLAMVFLPGEVVVDYSLRLKREFDPRRLWINAYANDAPCYIPSERILKEGGYEGGGAMIYYDQPNQFAPGLEQQILDVIHEQIPESFKVPEGTDGSAPLPPEASLRSILMRPGMDIELVASEPMVVDPVAIDWDIDGRLWVVEMNDYPLGMSGAYEPGGRIKILQDTNRDGHYDKATVFLDGLAFPTGVTTWGKGALISAAPDLIYAEDKDGDGKADKKEVWYTGFATVNYQARINSISLGLDNWLYGANGLIGGDILPVAIGKTANESRTPISIRRHDFRFNPWSGAFETVSGLTQQGRVRDDFGNWFGCSNGALIYHFPVDAAMMSRNPYVMPPPAHQFNWKDPDPNRLYPISEPLERFNDLDHLNRVTSACGLGLYRDTWLGPNFEGNAFTCEPVHNLVRRTILERNGNTFSGRRAGDEQTSEFLASTDQWFRPSQVRTGPDGALWIVDMYRFLMEHPIWIRPDRLAKLDPRAGDQMGRIYRVYPTGKRPKSFHGLASLNKTQSTQTNNHSSGALTHAMQSANGTVRDLAHQHLILNKDLDSIPALKYLTKNSPNPAVRLQSLCALEGLQALSSDQIQTALKDAHPGVRAEAARLAESHMTNNDELIPALISLLEDPDTQVRTRTVAALHGLGNKESEIDAYKNIGKAMGRFLLQNTSSPYATSAAWSAAVPFLHEIGNILLNSTENEADLDLLLPTLIQIADRAKNKSVMFDIAERIGREAEKKAGTYRAISRLATYTKSATTWNLNDWLAPQAPDLAHTDITTGFQEILERAREYVLNEKVPLKTRDECLTLLGWDPRKHVEDLEILLSLLDRTDNESLHAAIFKAFSRFDTEDLPAQLLSRWKQSNPKKRKSMIQVMLQRTNWTNTLLAHAKETPGVWQEIPSTRRNALLRHTDSTIRDLATDLEKERSHSERSVVVSQFQPAAKLVGDPVRGKEWFTQRCATCHQLDGIGKPVGPDLLELTDKSPESLMISIIDPNRAVLDQYTVYEIETQDGRSLSGAISEESKAGISYKNANGDLETIAQDGIQSIRATGLSLMPEGLEAGMKHQDMADLTAFIAQAQSSKEPPPRDPGVIAKYLLDDEIPEKEREAAIKVHYMLAVELVREMVRDIPVGTPEEYRRIPWIWRLAIQTGKGNDNDRIRRMLDLSLPQPNQPLHDWQAVIIGGGLINGLSQNEVWPKQRLDSLIKGDSDLENRYKHALILAVNMADNAKIPSGTRYDALRMIAMLEPSNAIPHLKRYLRTETEQELQMGAISALADIRHPTALNVLKTAFDELTGTNQTLARKGIERLRAFFEDQ